MVAFSSSPTIQLRLPAGTDNQSMVHIVGSIRDKLDAVTEYNLSSVVVTSDSEEVTSLVDSIRSSSTEMSSNPLVQILSSGNQNKVGQVITSLSQQFNQINQQTQQNAIASEITTDNSPFSLNDLFSSIDGIPSAEIVVSPLSSRIPSSQVSLSIIFSN